MEEQIDETVTYGSGNVFADLDLPNAKEMLSKAALASAIQDVIETRALSQAEAAVLMGIDQPKVSALSKYKLEGFSVERLMRFLTCLDQDVEIVVRQPTRPRA